MEFQAKNKTVEYYMDLPYTVEVTRSDDGLFAKVLELPGCMTWADSYEELGPMIEDAKVTWIEGSIEEGLPIPEPGEVEEYSGKVNLRMPKSLHRDLVRRAGREGVSLNQFMVTTLARSVGEDNRAKPAGLSPQAKEAFTQMMHDVMKTLSTRPADEQAEQTTERARRPDL
jgi:antitoxin HicB